MTDAAATTDLAEATVTLSAAPWLELITDAEKAFQPYQDKADGIDKQYANLAAMAGVSTDREFKIFWANLEVLKPSIYAKPPIPAVIPRFKDNKPKPRKAAEVLERCIGTTFERAGLDAVLRYVRDDLVVNARGVPWLRYEADFDEAKGGDGLDEGAEPGMEAEPPAPQLKDERVCIEHVDRHDFLHDPARKWEEVGWVARRSWLTRERGMKRFGPVFSGVRMAGKGEQAGKENDPDYNSGEKAEVWELWHKAELVVVWISPGVETVLDMQEPWLTLEGFYPCPRPAYSTVQRGTLIPVPDFLYYKDQVEEINELTARISALSESLKMKGFYAGGQEDVSEAIETAMKQTDNRAILIPVPNFAALGGASLKDSIIWLPVDMVAMTIEKLVLLRKQLIEDVYQISGLSDIMRGATDPDETLGAQQLKSQYGSVRTRDRQGEMVRLARDITRMCGEIMAENFSPDTFLAMAQMAEDLPTRAVLTQRAEQIQQQAQQQVAQLKQQVQQAVANPQVQQAAQANPQQAQQALQQAQQQAQQIMQQAGQQIEAMKQVVTIDDVMELYQSQQMRAFTLDIETDSTIQPDEDAAKQRATEFIIAVGGFMQQAIPLAMQVPQAAPLVTEMLKYVASQFRAGRQLEGVIEQFTDEMKQAAKQPKPPDPEQVKAEAEAKAMEADIAIKRQDMKASAEAHQADMQMKQLDMHAKQQDSGTDAGVKAAELELKQREAAFNAEIETAKLAFEQQKHIDEMEIERLKIDAAAKAKRDDAFAAMGGSKRKGKDAAGNDTEDSPFDEIMGAMQQMAESMTATNARLSGRLGDMKTVMVAPVEIIRDAQGRAAGARKVLPGNGTKKS